MLGNVDFKARCEVSEGPVMEECFLTSASLSSSFLKLTLDFSVQQGLGEGGAHSGFFNVELVTVGFIGTTEPGRRGKPFKVWICKEIFSR